MRPQFELNGSAAANFKKLALVIPKIMSKMSTKTIGVIPSSVVAFHKEIAQPGEAILRCGMFKAKVKKLLFMLDPIEGKLVPEYMLRLTMGMEERKIKVNTKKLSHIMEVDIDVPDGAILELVQTVEGIVLHNVYVTALVCFNQNLNTVKEFVTSELLEEADDEGI